MKLLQLLRLLICSSPWWTYSTTPGGLVRRDRSRQNHQAELSKALEAALVNVQAQRLLSVESVVRKTYEAFWKNAQGEIPFELILASIVRNYFSRTHGWLLKELEPPSMRPYPVTEVFGTAILRDKAPKVAAALEAATKAKGGLALNDIVKVIAVIEHLVLDTMLPTVKAAFRLNGWALTDKLTGEALHDVLRSYILLFRQGKHANLTNFRHHARTKALARNDTEGWSSLASFEQSVLGHAHGSKFDDVLRISRELTMKFGEYQNGECSAMKSDLMSADPTKSGRILYDDFIKLPAKTAYQFSESVQYLRDINAIDETDAKKPKVLIANYVLALSNCIASTDYYSICCLTECTGIMSELEGRLQLPATGPDEMFTLVQEVAADNSKYHMADAEATLRSELQVIASAHDGKVPLHSGGFLMWLHRAFPDECPYPTVGESNAEESESQAAERWQAVEAEQCTRVPQWLTSSARDKYTPEQAEFI